MKRLKPYIPYIISALIGGAIMPWAIAYAEQERGQAGQVGGEYLIIPLLWVIIALLKTIYNIIKEAANQ